MKTNNLVAQFAYSYSIIFKKLHFKTQNLIFIYYTIFSQLKIRCKKQEWNGF